MLRLLQDKETFHRVIVGKPYYEPFGIEPQVHALHYQHKCRALRAKGTVRRVQSPPPPGVHIGQADRLRACSRSIIHWICRAAVVLIAAGHRGAHLCLPAEEEGPQADRG